MNGFNFPKASTTPSTNTGNTAKPNLFGQQSTLGATGGATFGNKTSILGNSGKTATPTSTNTKQSCPEEILKYFNEGTQPTKVYPREEIIFWSIIYKKEKESKESEKVEKLEFEFPPPIQMPSAQTAQNKSMFGTQQGTQQQQQKQQQAQVTYNNSFDSVTQEPVPVLTAGPYFLPTERIGNRKNNEIDFSYKISRRSTKAPKQKENYSSLFLQQLSLIDLFDITDEICDLEPIKLNPEQIKSINPELKSPIQIKENNFPSKHLKCYNDEGEIYFLNIPENLSINLLKNNIDIYTHFINVSHKLLRQSKLGPALITINHLKIELEDNPEYYLRQICLEKGLTFISYREETGKFAFFADDFSNVPFSF